MFDVRLKDIDYVRKEYDKICDRHDLIFLGLGGSYAYGTNIESSDVDIRGIYINPRDEIFGITRDSEQTVSNTTDTVLYSLKKIAGLLAGCNPNVIEMLGLRDDEILYMTPEAKKLFAHKEIFLSKRAIKTFGNYALSQLNRLINRSGRANDEILANEQRSFEKAFSAFGDRYGAFGEAKAIHTDDDIRLSLNFKDMPIEKVSAVLNEINAIHKDYSKSRRNDKAIAHNKIAKHMMHLIRLYLMGADILNGEIVTYREDEHDLLMAIRNGEYLKEDGVTPTDEFGELLEEYKERFERAAKDTKLPDEPDYGAINILIEEIIRTYYKI